MGIVHLPAVGVVGVEGIALVAMTAAGKGAQHMLYNVKVN
jgi:hypothetical protein